MKTPYTTSVIIDLPDWIERFLCETNNSFQTIQNRMSLVIELANRNIQNKTGGPFGAAVFDSQNGTLVSVGVNLVTSLNQSIAHAEIVALMQAQSKLGSFDLGAAGLPDCQLVTSTAPCAMCLGAIPWSGVKSVVCGAREEDASEVGFDEGAKPQNWVGHLEKRGIRVILDVCRESAAETLRSYAREGGVIYNGRDSKSGELS